MRKTIVLAAVALSLSACGWRRQHLTESYGLSYDQAFAAQRERTNKPPAAAATGLDAQESAIISDTYRRGLAPKGGSASQEPLILVSPNSQSRPNLPPPSVPKE